jgi:hypothetical protein
MKTDFLFMRRYGTPAFGVNPAEHLANVKQKIDHIKQKSSDAKPKKSEQLEQPEMETHIQCPMCNRSYSREEYERHLRACDIRDKAQSSKASQRKQAERKAEELPDYEVLVKRVISLERIVQRQNEVIERLNRFMKKETRKISICEWLNREVKPVETFSQYLERIIIESQDILYLYDNHYFDTICQIVCRHLREKSECPVRAFQQKKGNLYVYDSLSGLEELKINIKTDKNDDYQWFCVSFQCFKYVLEIVKKRLYRKVSEWMKEHREDRETIQMMGAIRKIGTMNDDPDLRCRRILGKIFQKIKDDHIITNVGAV